MLRKGGEYKPEHARDVCDGLATFWPRNVPLRRLILTDEPIGMDGVEELPLTRGWPGWWSKLEVFDPQLKGFGDLLYVDLDTIIVGNLDDVVSVGRLTALQDFYRSRRLGSGLMYLPVDGRAEVWDRWMEEPDKLIRQYKGDQNFLEAVWGERAARWQKLLPGQVVSYKVHVRPIGTVPANARVVCFHGKPRPWHLDGGLP